jgi:hypothetical protein
MALERRVVSGLKLYLLDICEAIGDDHLCPGMNVLDSFPDHDAFFPRCSICACASMPRDDSHSHLLSA